MKANSNTGLYHNALDHFEEAELYTGLFALTFALMMDVQELKAVCQELRNEVLFLRGGTEEI